MNKTETGIDNIVWKLSCKKGRQVWTPKLIREGEEKIEHTFLETHLLTKPSNNTSPTYENENPMFSTVEAAAKEAMYFYTQIQTENGHWAGDYGGPMFLLPGLIIATYIMGIKYPQPYYEEMKRYMLNHQRKDGGWGLHIEGESTMFGTCLQYIALRLIGLGAQETEAQKARAFINREGGPGTCPQWGKFYMCALNVFSWEGIDPVPPELWCLPTWVPLIHPSKWWCHCRVVYLAMSYVYGMKAQCNVTPLIEELRRELFPYAKYENIQWSKFRGVVNKRDNYYPAQWPWKVLKHAAIAYEKIFVNNIPGGDFLRKWGCAETIKHIKQEDISTSFICIGPVNKMMNMLACYFAEGLSNHTMQHLPRLYDYMWMGDDGLKCQGENGSQLWDTAFACQAMMESPELIKKDEKILRSLKKAEEFIDYTQILRNPPEYERFYRQLTDGAWPFTTVDQGYTISDCTAEGLKLCLMYRHSPHLISKVSDERLFRAVNVILSMHNPSSGGWGSYELMRTYPIIECLNPAALFGEIMVDYPHTECTSACMQGLIEFQKTFPQHRKQEIDHALKTGEAYIRSRQMEHGGWYSSWAVCFCYAAWFAITALAKRGGTYQTDENIRKGCEFLIRHQLEDGGWGESYESCIKKEYISTKRSQVINTSWALMALMAAGYPNKVVMKAGINLILRRQQPNGDFPQEEISGVFNHNCMITYTSYRNVFPIWALNMYHRLNNDA